jgi:hypothetical protein
MSVREVDTEAAARPAGGAGLSNAGPRHAAPGVAKRTTGAGGRRSHRRSGALRGWWQRAGHGAPFPHQGSRPAKAKAGKGPIFPTSLEPYTFYQQGKRLPQSGLALPPVVLHNAEHVNRRQSESRPAPRAVIHRLLTPGANEAGTAHVATGRARIGNRPLGPPETGTPRRCAGERGLRLEGEKRPTRARRTAGVSKGARQGLIFRSPYVNDAFRQRQAPARHFHRRTFSVPPEIGEQDTGSVSARSPASPLGPARAERS